MTATKDTPDAKPHAQPRLLIGLLFLLFILASYQFWRISNQNKRIELLQNDHLELITRLEQQEKQTDLLLTQLNQLLENSPDSLLGGNPALDAVDVSTMADGLYTYEDKIKMSTISGGRKSSYEKEYKVNVIKTGIGAGGLKLDFVIGLGTCTGLPQFFIDYDGDKLVDLDIMQELVESLPMGGMLGKKMNIGNSQSLYDNFLLQHKEAAHLAPSEIDDKGGAIAKSLWKVVSEQSGKIVKLIQK